MRNAIAAGGQVTRVRPLRGGISASVHLVHLAEVDRLHAFGEMAAALFEQRRGVAEGHCARDHEARSFAPDHFFSRTGEVGGLPAGYFELDTAPPEETELRYFGLIPEFIGRGLGPFMLRAAIDRAWSRRLRRLWVHTRTFDHPKALGHYQRAGFVVYARQKLRFEDPRTRGILPRSLKHPLLPPLEDA